MDKLADIEKRKFNKLRRKFGKLLKNISKLDETKLDMNLIKQMNLINNNIEILINLIKEINLNIKKKGDNLSDQLKNKIKNDEEIQKIINKFLPYMFLYQLNNN